MSSERSKAIAARRIEPSQEVPQRRPRFAPAHMDQWTPALGRLMELRLRRCASKFAAVLNWSADAVEWCADPAPFRTDLPRRQAYFAWRRQGPVSGRLVPRVDLLIEEVVDALRCNWTALRNDRARRCEPPSDPAAPRRRGRPRGGSPFLQGLATDLAELYWAHADGKPTRRVDPVSGAEYGPFREFVELALVALPPHVRRSCKGGTKSVDYIVRLGVVHINRLIAATHATRANKTP